jgi:hypothetical protein
VILLALLGCPPRQLPPPSDALLVGQVTLSIDHDRGIARFRVMLHEPVAAPLPSERQGIPLDACETLVPDQRSDYGRVYRQAAVSLDCAGERPLQQDAPGLWSHAFEQPPAPGTRCTLWLDGQAHALPPVPEPPDLELRAGTLSWTPQGADEVRVSIPRAEGRSTLCRLVDDGLAPAPAHMRGRQAFVTRVELDQVRLEDGRLPMASIAGTWL